MMARFHDVALVVVVRVVLIVVVFVIADDRAARIVMMLADMLVRRDVQPWEHLEASDP
jgi:hypothetical protein